MSAKSSSSPRSFFWTAHRWLGIGLCVLLIPIAVTGALQVWKDHVDALLHPARYAVSGPDMAQPLATYLKNAGEAAGAKAQPIGIRFPAGPGWPVIVQAHEPQGKGRPRLINVYLDPASGRVLDTVDFRASLLGFLHRFHENLTIPQYSGRAIVGWGGVAMLILALSGIYLWWPRNGVFRSGLRWSRSPATSSNLHHLLGFWISLPLAFVSLTGIYLSFPQTARTAMTSVLPMGPSQRGLFGGPLARDVQMTPEQAVAAALAGREGARPAVLFLPVGGGSSKGRRSAGQGEGAPAITWRAQIRVPGESGLVTMLVDDGSGAARQMPDPLAGDRAAQWIRWLHEGSNSGPVWKVIVFLTGVFPPIFAVTGIMMWLRQRRQRRALAGMRDGRGSLQAAE